MAISMGMATQNNANGISSARETQHMPDSPLIVIKIGGSLLTLPDLAARLEPLLNRRPDIRPVFVAGGGAAADAVRLWDAACSLGETISHELAMESLNVTAKLLAHLLPYGSLIESRRQAEACWELRQHPILRLQDWMREPEAKSDELPQTWDVTSDSLAAWLAARWRADELWLLKSADLPAEISVEEASRQELVDRFFPQIAEEVRTIRWGNLRAATPTLEPWRRNA
jgi:aspartokinase-like uncharacterized kinase